MKKLIVWASVLGVLAVVLPLVVAWLGCHGLFKWSPEISYDDILVPITILVPFLVFVKTWEQSKKDSERKGVFEFLNINYIHKECVVDILKFEKSSLFQNSGCVVRGGNRILLRDLRHIFFRYSKDNNADWVDKSSSLEERTLENQVAFNLADNLELLGEALVAGFLPFREAVSFVGNNIVEDWLGSYNWVDKLRKQDRDAFKRVNGELIACMAFLFYYVQGYYVQGRKDYLRHLRELYPQSFASAYGKESDLAMVAQHVKSRMLEILKQIGFVEPALKGEIRDLKRKADRITRTTQKGRT